MSDVAIPASDEPLTNRQLARRNATAINRVTGRLRDALRLMVWERMRDNEAACQAGITVTALRDALRKPHVLGWYREQLQVLRARERPANIHALVDVRDQQINQMARVQAVKALEQLDTEHQTTGSKAHSPGFVVIVQAHAVQPDANPTKPLITLENTKDVP